MFVHTLAAAWAGRVSFPDPDESAAIKEWLGQLAGLDSSAVLRAMIDAPEDRRRAAVVTLLSRIARDIAAGLRSGLTASGQLLQAMVVNGHGIDFPGGDLVSAHAEFAIGLGHHLSASLSAHRAYSLAALAYSSRSVPVLAALSNLAVATVARATIEEGEYDGVDERLSALAVMDEALGAELRAEFTASLQPVLEAIAQVISGGEAVALPENLETAELLRARAIGSTADPDRAARLARLADRMHLWTEDEGPAMFSVAQILLSERRWTEALPLLVELDASPSGNSAVKLATARVYAELGRWTEGRALLTGLLGEELGPDDLPVLTQLFWLSQRANDNESEQWRSRIVAIDPAADPASGLPTRVPQQAPEEVELAVLADGQLNLTDELLARPPEEAQLHITAAIVVGSPEGPQLLADSLAAAPEQAETLLTMVANYRRAANRRHAERLIAEGETLFAARQLDEAKRRYQDALELAPDWALPLTLVGDVEYTLGRYHLAQAWFEEALAIWPDAQTYRFLGDAILRGGHPAIFARRAYQEALALDPNYRGAQEALAALALPPAQSEPEPAKPDPGEPDSIEIPEAPVVPADPSAPVGSAGDELLAAMRGKPELDSGPALAENSEDFMAWLAGASTGEIRRALFQAVALAWLYQARDNDTARSAYWMGRQQQLAEALPVDYGPANAVDGIGRNRLVAEALAAQAQVLVDQGQRPEAKLMLLDALRLFDAEDEQRRIAGLTGEPEYDRLFSQTSPRAGLLRQLAGLHRDLGEATAAMDLERQALALENARPTREAVVDGLVDTGHGLLAKGELNDALGYFQEALCIAEDAESIELVPRMQARSLNGLGLAHRRVGLGRTALGYLDRAQQLNARRRNVNRLSADYLAIGQVLREFPQLEGLVGPGDAREFVENALALASAPTADPADELGWISRGGIHYRISSPDRAWPALLERAEIARDTADFATAARTYELAVRIADAVRAGVAEPEQRIAVQNARVDAHLGLVQSYLALADAALGAYTPADFDTSAEAARDAAWQAYEAMRARTFLDVLGEAELAVPAEVPESLIQQERALLLRRRELRSTTRQDQAFWVDYRQVEQALAAVWREMLAATPNAESYVEIREARPADSADLAGELVASDGPVAVLASLIIMDANTLAVLALRPDNPSPVVERVPVRVLDLTAFLRQNFGAADRVRDLASDLAELFHDQMAPVTELLSRVCDPDEVLVICPTGALHHVPLGAARCGTQILLERNPLALLPSASMIRALRSAVHAPAGRAAAVFGDPTGDLVGGRQEAAKVAQRFGVEALLGPAATREAVLSGLTGAAVLHVSAHARFDASDPMASGVRLADGVLTAREIISQRAPGLSLVAMSACETGISQTDQAEELLGLTRSLLFAGADSVLVSLWKVPDRPTEMIMDSFYAGLATTSKVRALQAAALAGREEYGIDRFDRWAAFQLMGDWR